jgi:hypothetical protein
MWKLTIRTKKNDEFYGKSFEFNDYLLKSSRSERFDLKSDIESFGNCIAVIMKNAKTNNRSPALSEIRNQIFRCAN